MYRESSRLDGASVYTAAPADPQALLLHAGVFGMVGDGVHDDTAAFEQALAMTAGEAPPWQQPTGGNRLILLAEGTYKVSRTLHIPRGVRLIGYGAKRPTVVLADNAEGFDHWGGTDFYGIPCPKPVFWFTANLPRIGGRVFDANPGTFYSAWDNIDLHLGNGNPAAAGFRAHYAQHCFIAHTDIHIGKSFTGVWEGGNEMTAVRFFGGEYGMYTGKPSPGWPFMTVDTYFEGQRQSAMLTRESGLTMVRLTAEDVPCVVRSIAGRFEKIFVRDGQFCRVRDTALELFDLADPLTQINLRDIACEQVPVFARADGKDIATAPSACYTVSAFTTGAVMDGLDTPERMVTEFEATAVSALPQTVVSDIPQLPPISEWVSAKDCGALGDGETDDTAALQAAIDAHDTVYLPQGRYRLSATLRLRPHTALIGLHPYNTVLLLPDRTPEFGGFGSPLPLVEVPDGNALINGIGIDAGGANPRAVACLWKGGADSYMNDVKFLGGHGSYGRPYNDTHTGDNDPDRRWDSQHASLWIQGGGVFKDVWTASPYAATGLLIQNTNVPGRIYAISLEHHVRSEAVLDRVSNWRIYAFQFEEELPEGEYALPLEMQNCENIELAAVYAYRTIRLVTPSPLLIRTRGCRHCTLLNLHNYTQTKFAHTMLLVDDTTQRQVKAWELSRLVLRGDEAAQPPVTVYVRVAGDFRFATSCCSDRRGRVYFVDELGRRIYRYDPTVGVAETVASLPFIPMGMGVDGQDRLLVTTEYVPMNQPGAPRRWLGDSIGPTYAMWYYPNVVPRILRLDPDAPENGFEVLPRVETATLDLDRVHKMYHPSNRWRDAGDFAAVAAAPTDYVFDGGDTVIPDHPDLMHACGLVASVEGQTAYLIDEYRLRTYRFEVDAHGRLTDGKLFANKGDHGVAVAPDGRVYIACGDIYEYAPDGTLLRILPTTERPTSLTFGGEAHDRLFAAAHTGLYEVLL